MLQNVLKLNRSKTELLILNAKHCPSRPTCIATVTIGDAVINPSKTARNIVVVFDSSPSMEEHVKASCKSAFFHLTNTAQIWKHLPAQAAETLIHSLVTSKVDFCNSLLYGVPNQLIRKLQSVQSSVARLSTDILTNNQNWWIMPYFTMRCHLHYINWWLKICIWQLHFCSLSPKGDPRIFLILSPARVNSKLSVSSFKKELKTYLFKIAS